MRLAPRAPFLPVLILMPVAALADAPAAGQSSYDMFVNPRGVQGDILTSSSAGEQLAPDWVWDSAGQTTAEGYTVEIRLPLKSIRFKSGRDVRMGIMFWRRVSR